MLLRKILLVVTSAILGVLVFEPYGIWPLALVAWIPFLIALRGANTRTSFRLGLLHGFITFAWALCWLWNIFETTSIALWAMLACFTAIWAALISAGKISSSWIIATLWTGLEYFRGELFTLSFPWITPGTGLPPNWFTPVVGTYGITFLIILASALTVKNFKIGSTITLLLLLSTLTFKTATPDSPALKIGLIQDESGVDTYYHQASQKIANDVDILVWPEYALGHFKGSNPYATKILSHRAQLLVSGARITDPENNSQWLNSAVTLSPEKLLGRHTKNYPVHLFDDGEKGTTAYAVDTQFGRIGTPVCFDCDHQDVIRKMTSDGAQILLVPSMDAEHWSARQHEQHAALVRHRAAENHRWMGIASTSGVTQVVSPDGKATARLPLMDEGVLVSDIYLSSSTTLFQRFGWLVGPASFVFLAAWLVVRLFRYVQKMNSAHH